MDESSVEYELCVVKRGILPADLPFIYSTWRNQCFYGAPSPITQSPKIFFKRQTERITEILDRATTSVACLESDPDLVIGYSVFAGTHLYWVYVKKDYRNKGIGTLLCPKDIKSATLGQTELGNDLANKRGISDT